MNPKDETLYADEAAAVEASEARSAPLDDTARRVLGSVAADSFRDPEVLALKLYAGRIRARSGRFAATVSSSTCSGARPSECGVVRK